MAEMAWQHAAEARAALKAIVNDPEHGIDALSSPRTMSNLLNDLLPDAPREKSLLVSAAEAGLAGTLREHVAQGMDSATAIRLTAVSFSARTPLTPDACSWVAGEIAVALGISKTNDAGYSPGPTVTSPGPTVTSPGLTVTSPGLTVTSPGPGRSPEPDSAGQASGKAGFAPGPTDFAARSTASPKESTAYPPGAAGFSPGASGYSPGAGGFSPGSGGYPSGFSEMQEKFFGSAPGIGYPPVQVPRSSRATKLGWPQARARATAWPSRPWCSA